MRKYSSNFVIDFSKYMEKSSQSFSQLGTIWDEKKIFLTTRECIEILCPVYFFLCKQTCVKSDLWDVVRKLVSVFVIGLIETICKYSNSRLMIDELKSIVIDRWTVCRKELFTGTVPGIQAATSLADSASSRVIVSAEVVTVYWLAALIDSLTTVHKQSFGRSILRNTTDEGSSAARHCSVLISRFFSCSMGFGFLIS